MKLTCFCNFTCLLMTLKVEVTKLGKEFYQMARGKACAYFDFEDLSEAECSS
eukprot:Awhi_evm2s14886